jgi:hypothetical protein
VDDAAEDVVPADLAVVGLRGMRQWGRELASAVWASLVVVAHVIGEHRFEVTPRGEEQMVEAVFTHGADEALGDRSGARMASMPMALNTSSKVAVNFVARSRMRKRKPLPASSRSEVKLRATWATQALTGRVVTPSRCTTGLSTSMTSRT